MCVCSYYKGLSLKKTRLYSVLTKSLGLTLGVLFIMACSTQKETWLNRGYHNMTAHYNGYFNAREIIKETKRTHVENFQQDYTQIIPIYLNPDDETVSNFQQPMETAIEKITVVISKNSMPNPEKLKRKKKEEWCKWIDDNWMVMGQAYFYKREFDDANTYFKYVKAQYPSQQIVFDADIWLAKTAIEMEDYGTALSTLELLEEAIKEAEAEAKKSKSKKKKKKKSRSKSFKKYNIQRPINKFTPPPVPPKNLKSEVYINLADLHLRKGDYQEAIPRLEQAIEHNKSRKMRTRLTFILAQVHEELGNVSEARKYYEKVTKMTAPYEMEFYATINKALLFDGNDTKGLRAQLIKMSKDEKNKDFLDQIYYVLAELDFKEGDKDGGIAYLEKSAKYSTSNNIQKAKTYVRLADIYYSDKAYPKSKVYYDSSLTVIDETYENYDEIFDRSEGLTSLVKNLDVYHTQDSLLTLVEKGENHYMKVIENKIHEKQRLDEEKFNERQNAPSTGTTNNNNFGSGAKWYFYNESAKSFGVNEFKQIWGDRPLEDNWRRSDKTVAGLGTFGDGEDEDQNSPENDPYAPEYYLKNLPLTDEAQAESNTKISEALYNLGVIYKDRLGEPKTGISYFEKLVQRYNDTKESLPGMYQLYLTHKAEGNMPESDKYKKMILDKFPDSEYAKIIRNPNFKKEEELAKKKHGNEYNKVFDMYLAGDYETTIDKCKEVVNRRESNVYVPKYLLLQAFALSMKDSKNLDAIQKPLESLVDNHSETEEGVRAKNILERLKNQNSIKGVKAGNSSFVYNSEMEHFFVLIFPNSAGSINQVKKTISNFNNSNYSSKGLKVRNSFIDTDNQIIVVRSFNDKKIAEQYLKSFSTSSKTKDLSGKYKNFIITHKNYASLFIEKDIDGYMEFYKKNY